MLTLLALMFIEIMYVVVFGCSLIILWFSMASFRFLLCFDDFSEHARWTDPKEGMLPKCFCLSSLSLSQTAIRCLMSTFLFAPLMKDATSESLYRR